MFARRHVAFFALAAAATMAATLNLTACNDRSTPPTAVRSDPMAATGHGMHDAVPLAAAEAPVPFTYRGAIDAYKLHQLPDFMMHSKVRTDIVMQRSIFNVGAGPWHTHPGPSFIYVVSGEIRLDQVVGEHQCVQTPVYGTGGVYYEQADQVHRAVVVSAEPAVVLVTRFNIPVGSPVTIPAADPGC